MTTTVPAMEETIKQLRKKAPWAKIVVGGAVLNREYAERIGKPVDEFKATLGQGEIAYLENQVITEKLLEFLKSENTIA
jgi:hypothetical protein